MRRSFTLTTLILTLGLLLVGSIAATPAKSASASPKKNDRGFEL